MEKDGATERVLRADLMKRQGVIPKRPLEALPLQGTVRKGELSVPGDAAVIDGTLRRLGYLHTTKPTEADREGGLNRASLQLVNKAFAGMTDGDALHTRLAETVAMKDVDEGKVTRPTEDSVPSEGGPFGHAEHHPSFLARKYKWEQAWAPYGGPPPGMRFEDTLPTPPTPEDYRNHRLREIEEDSSSQYSGPNFFPGGIRG
jgi:hypothetical protein